MMEKRKVGRPTKAAQSLDEALRMVYTGQAPKRGRNALERGVMSTGRNGKRGGGRQVNPQSKTQQAADLAAYLMKTDGVSFAEATRRAAETYSVNRDNVRKYTRRTLQGPVVPISATVNARYSQLVPGGVAVEMRQLVVSITDASYAS